MSALHAVTFAWSPTVDPIAAFPLDSTYVEQFWLPVVGPTSLCLARFGTRMLGQDLTPVTVPASEVAQALGTKGVGSDSPMRRSIARLVRFRLAEETLSPFAGVVMLELRATVPVVPKHLAERYFTPAMLQAHRGTLEDLAAEPA